MNTRLLIGVLSFILIVAASAAIYFKQGQSDSAPDQTVPSTTPTSNSSTSVSPSSKSNNQAQDPIPATGWLTYTNSKYELSFSYPPTFFITEKDWGTTFTAVVRASNDGPLYLKVAAFSSKDPNYPHLISLFEGPYPTKSTDANSASLEVIVKHFNGYSGVEEYGPVSEGHDYTDAFLFKGINYIYEVGLNPILEKRIKASDYPNEDATLDPTTYAQILSSIQMK